MADVLIRGMEMPKYTTKAEFGIDADGNPLCMIYHQDGTEPDIYDVIPLPAGHGRLIDADAIEYTYTTARGTDDGHNWRIFAVGQDEVDDMPTIMPAEGGGEDG